MKGINRRNEIREVVYKTCLNNRDYNGLSHLTGVAYISGYLALERHLDEEICICAGYMHDLWLFDGLCNPPFDGSLYGMHGYYGSILARKILDETKRFNEEEIDLICNMICNHHDKEKVHDQYSELLKDADVLHHFLTNSEYDKNYKHIKRVNKIIKYQKI